MPLPACDARSVQVPPVRMLTDVPLTLHTAGVSEAKLTTRPELALAATLKPPDGAKVCAAIGLKVIVCADLSTVNVLRTSAAAL